MTKSTTPDASLITPLLESLVRIGAPTGREHRRAAFIRDWLTRQGVPNVQMDEVQNVFVRLGPPGPALMLDAHTDTVFPDEHLTIDKRPDGRWFCPGIMDNTAACAILMVYARHLLQHPPAIPLLISFTVGEEGRGDLLGIKKLLQSQRDTVAAVIALDLNLDAYTRRCVGSTRFNITFAVPGGHSWNDFGRPSALHAAAQWIATLPSLAPWRPAYLTYNVGTLQGGTGVNAIAADAQLQLDLRSIDPAALQQVETDILASLGQQAQTTPSLTITPQCIGRRPAGQLPPGHPLIALLEQTHQRLNLPLTENARSTNANWPTHLGLPALCTGLVTGGGVHTRDEFLHTPSLHTGLTKLATLLQFASAQWPL